MANISSYNQLSSWNEDDDLLFVQQPDAPKKAHPSQMKEYILRGLDVSSVGGTGKYISEISEADGKISATAETMDEAPTEGSSKLAKSGGIKAAIDNRVEIQNNAGFHNSIYRGKFLGTEVTAEQYAAIANGTFDDMFIGDFWTIDGVNYRIAAFEYWLHCGNVECTTHHVVLVPDTNLDTQKMNDSNVTTGGYVGSKMYTSYITTARNKVISAFGSANILVHKLLFTNAVDGNYANSWSWYDSTIDLMSECMVYGAPIGGKAKVDSTNFNVGIDKVQLPLFALDPSRITNRANWWLRDVVSSTSFAFVHGNGNAAYSEAGTAIGVRPAFGIKA